MIIINSLPKQFDCKETSKRPSGEKRLQSGGRHQELNVPHVTNKNHIKQWTNIKILI